MSVASPPLIDPEALAIVQRAFPGLRTELQAQLDKLQAQLGRLAVHSDGRVQLPTTSTAVATYVAAVLPVVLQEQYYRTALAELDGADSQGPSVPDQVQELLERWHNGMYVATLPDAIAGCAANFAREIRQQIEVIDAALALRYPEREEGFARPKEWEQGELRDAYPPWANAALRDLVHVGEQLRKRAELAARLEALTTGDPLEAVCEETKARLVHHEWKVCRIRS